MTDMNTGEIITYAQRLLNPFRGVVNVIKYRSAEAVTMDGVHWDLYVANDSLSKGLTGRAQISDIRFGSWNEREGLKRGPLYPSEDFKRMEAQGQVVYAYLRAHGQEAPFAFADAYECWMFDEEGRPMALLHSVLTEEEARAEMRAPASLRWRAGYAAEAQFRSEVAGIGNAAEMLNAWINGRVTATKWIARLPDGSGMSLTDGRSHAAGSFPALFLEPEHHVPPYAQLIADYLGWQAPWLLLLDTLETDARAALEIQARSRAAEMVKQHRLYPAQADPAQLKAARVEMILRDRRSESQEVAHTSMSPFYIELSPAGGEYT